MLFECVGRLQGSKGDGAGLETGAGLANCSLNRAARWCACMCMHARVCVHKRAACLH